MAALRSSFEVGVAKRIDKKYCHMHEPPAPAGPSQEYHSIEFSVYRTFQYTEHPLVPKWSVY